MKKYLPLISELDNVKLFKALREIHRNLKDGVFNSLESTGFTISEKFDSVSCSFGINENDELFFESERCSAEEKEQALSFVKSNKLLEVVLKNLKKQNGPIRFEAEFIPTFSHEFDENNNAVFGSVPYNKEFLGEAGAFVVYDALVHNPELNRWQEVPDNIRPGIRTNFTEIKDADCKHWRVYTKEDFIVDQPIGTSINCAAIKEYFENDELFEHGVKILQSSWKTPERQRLVKEISSLKEQFSNDLSLFTDSSVSNFGGEFTEGYVLNFENFATKVNSARYNETKDFNWSVRTSASKIVKECYKNLKKNVLQLSFRNSNTINEIINNKMGKIEETENDEIYIETIGNILESVISPDATFEGLKEKSAAIIEEANQSLAELEMRVDEYEFDRNTYRKTINRITESKEVLRKLKERFINTQLEGFEYLVNGFLEVFDSKLNVPKRPESIEEINIVYEERDRSELEKKISNMIWSKGAE